MNYEYIDNQGKPAPSSIILEGKRIVNPTEEQLLTAGYHKREIVQVENDADVVVDRETTIATLKDQINSLIYDITILRDQINELENGEGTTEANQGE